MNTFNDDALPEMKPSRLGKRKGGKMVYHSDHLPQKKIGRKYIRRSLDEKEADNEILLWENKDVFASR